ncbi:MAG: hydroxyisourate hydrolase [Chloroflexota bacterium]
MSGIEPTISTHVLDTGAGRPAAGIRVTLARIADDGAHVPAGEGITNLDGRVARLLEGPLTAGDYRLTFHVGDASPFFRRVDLELRVEDATRSYHVPLLLSPYGISSYRGS